MEGGGELQVRQPIVVGPRKGDVFYVVADQGKDATGMNSLGGITAIFAMAAPIEREPPVTRAVLPDSFKEVLVIAITPLVGFDGANIAFLFLYD
jgi:hypothetical protein